MILNSIFSMRTRKLVHGWRYSILNPRDKAERKNNAEYWRIKFKQTLILEKCRVIVDDDHYIVDPVNNLVMKLS